MRLNENVALVGADIVLVPYRKEHVPRYHEWMKDPAIQEATASEPLTLEQEYEMQRTWHIDEDKLTFILIEKPSDLSDLTAGMIGDVNLFLSDIEDEEATDTNIKNHLTQGAKQGELEIMIAEPNARRKGYAQQALRLMMSYACQSKSLSLKPQGLLVKIGRQNQGSIAMFRGLGFEIVKEVAVFDEVEMRLNRERIEELSRDIMSRRIEIKAC